MDWNWFFSALSQSAAALVGIFSAFIITKIVNNQMEFKKNLNRINMLLSRSLEYQKRIHKAPARLEVNDTLYVELNFHTIAIKNMLENVRTDPESSSLITYCIISLIVLFFVGVIYPLSFLPLRLDEPISLSFSAFFDILFSLKGGVLACVSVIFTSVAIVFLIINFRLKYAKDLTVQLEYFSNPDNYFPRGAE